jgi:glyoxylase-like metal-dependent hydrolase (beta-lactamase superfamily II)
VPLPEPILIPAFNPGAMTGRGNNTYLLPGGQSILIDAGVGDPRHVAALESALATHAATLTDVLITHAHPDHVSGVPALRRTWPSVRVWKFSWPDEDRRLGLLFAPLADGDRLGRDAVVEVVHTPGHSPDHCSVWLASTRTLLCGDLVQAGGTVVIPGSRGGNMAAYLASLRRVAALDPARMLPAHGAPIDRPLELVTTYLAHRQEREDQIVDAMRDGHSTVEAIVARVYAALPDAFAGAARDTVLAHLVKLDHDGRAGQVEGHWRLRQPDGASSL